MLPPNDFYDWNLCFCLLVVGIVWHGVLFYLESVEVEFCST